MTNRDLIRFLKYVEKTPTCWLWRGAKLPRGYGRFYFEGKPRYAHRVAITLFCEQHPSDNSVVMHSCDNPQCVNPEHLRIGTQAENMSDASRKGRIVVVSSWQGPNNPKGKLTAEQRLLVEAAINEGHRAKDISARFGISPERVGQIARVVRG